MSFAACELFTYHIELLASAIMLLKLSDTMADTAGLVGLKLPRPQASFEQFVHFLQRSACEFRHKEYHEYNTYNRIATEKPADLGT